MGHNSNPFPPMPAPHWGGEPTPTASLPVPGLIGEDSAGVLYREIDNMDVEIDNQMYNIAANQRAIVDAYATIDRLMDVRAKRAAELDRLAPAGWNPQRDTADMAFSPMPVGYAPPRFTREHPLRASPRPYKRKLSDTVAQSRNARFEDTDGDGENF